MDPLYDMMSYQSTDLYPQQVLPVNTASTDNYTLPTPPHSPPQITDLSGSLMGGHGRHFTLDPPQTFPTDLSLTDNLDNYLPDLFTCPFTSPQTYSVLPDHEEFSQVPSPTPSPVYYNEYQHDNYPPTSYVSQGRSFAGSVGDDSDQDGNFSDDTMHGSSQGSSHSSRRHGDLFTPASLFHGGAAGDPQRTHNYQRKTDPILMSELVEGLVSSNNGSRMKQKPQKRRPATSSDSATKGIKKSSRGKGRREAMKGNHLWEFIRDLLKNKTTCPRIIRWENRQEGVFRFVNSEAVAGLWGTKKNNPNMNYEKLSRAMRYYYKREILERVDGRRLVYKFGCNADGWKEAAAEATQDD